jgi:hypothetical protein
MCEAAAIDSCSWVSAREGQIIECFGFCCYLRRVGFELLFAAFTFGF